MQYCLLVLSLKTNWRKGFEKWHQAFSLRDSVTSLDLVLSPSSLVGDCQLTVKIKTNFAPLPCLPCVVPGPERDVIMDQTRPEQSLTWEERDSHSRAQPSTAGKTRDTMVLGPLCSPQLGSRLSQEIVQRAFSQVIDRQSKEAYIFARTWNYRQ